MAVDGIDLVVQRGECFGFLGPNGACEDHHHSPASRVCPHATQAISPCWGWTPTRMRVPSRPALGWCRRRSTSMLSSPCSRTCSSTHATSASHGRRPQPGRAIRANRGVTGGVWGRRPVAPCRGCRGGRGPCPYQHPSSNPRRPLHHRPRACAPRRRARRGVGPTHVVNAAGRRPVPLPLLWYFATHSVMEGNQMRLLGCSHRA